MTEPANTRDMTAAALKNEATRPYVLARMAYGVAKAAMPYEAQAPRNSEAGSIANAALTVLEELVAGRIAAARELATKLRPRMRMVAANAEYPALRQSLTNGAASLDTFIAQTEGMQ